MELLVHPPHSHIDPNRLFGMELENGNQSRVCVSTTLRLDGYSTDSVPPVSCKWT